MGAACTHQRFVADQDSYVVVQYLDGHTEYVAGPCAVFKNPFKHESVRSVRHVRHLATEKQCVDITHLDGRFERCFGPCQITFDPLKHSSCSVQTFKRHVASQGEYLVVQYKDGKKEHIRGPAAVNFHPLEHESIAMMEAIRLAANEALVVYRRDTAAPANPTGGPTPSLVAKLEVVPTVAAAKANGVHKGGHDDEGGGIVHRPAPVLTAEPVGQEGAQHVERRVVHGPAVFMPDSNEWLHTFSWHGSLKDGKGSKTGYQGDVKVPHALNFQVIRCMPDSMYLSVRDVRTVDDANLTVHLMLFYELKHIETLLDSTNDMIGDFVNAASADVMTFASRLTYETFLQETVELSRVANFPILASRMEQTGTALLKVVYRGYGASAQLQEMHDQAISRRTKLRLEADAAREEQEKRSMELRCRKERSVQEQELEEAAARHKLSVLALQKEQDRKLQDEEHAQALRYAQETAEIELASSRARHEEEMRRAKESNEIANQQLIAERKAEAEHYEGLKRLGVDLTQYLCALNTARPDQHLKIDTAGGATPNIHMELPRATTGARALSSR